MFKKRVKVYEKKLKEEKEMETSPREVKPVSDALTSYQQAEKRVSSMMETYF